MGPLVWQSCKESPSISSLHLCQSNHATAIFVRPRLGQDSIRDDLFSPVIRQVRPWGDCKWSCLLPLTPIHAEYELE